MASASVVPKTRNSTAIVLVVALVDLSSNNCLLLLLSVGGGDGGGDGGGLGGGGDGGDGGGDGGGGQAEESSNLAMTLPPAWSTGPSIPLAVCHLRATDAGNMILGAASLGSTLAVSGVNLGPLA